MFKRSLLMLSAVALLGAGCWTSPAPTSTDETKPEGIAAELIGNWKIKSMKLTGQSVKEVSDLTLLVGFDGQRMNGKVCNSMSGDYTVNGIVLKAPMVMSTKMFCEGDAGKAETAFTSGLSTGFEVMVKEDGTLMLTNGQTVLVLIKE